MTTVAILLPSRGRAAQLTERVTSLLWQVPPAGVTIYITLAVCLDDAETQTAAEALQHTSRFAQFRVESTSRPADSTAVQGWNMAYQFRRARGGADWYILGADDIVWVPGWLDAALAEARPGVEVIGLDDGGHTDLRLYAPHYMAQAAFVEEVLGGLFVPPEYYAWWFDREVCEVARARNAYSPAPGAVARHLHPDWQTARMDRTYRDAWPLHDVDRQTYLTRRAQGYPVTWRERCES